MQHGQKCAPALEPWSAPLPGGPFRVGDVVTVAPGYESQADARGGPLTTRQVRRCTLAKNGAPK